MHSIVSTAINKVLVLRVADSVSKEDVKFKQVDVPHIASVLKNVYDSRMTTTNRSFSETFPLQQKILIGTLLLILKKGKSKEVTIGRVS